MLHVAIADGVALELASELLCADHDLVLTVALEDRMAITIVPESAAGRAETWV